MTKKKRVIAKTRRASEKGYSTVRLITHQTRCGWDGSQRKVKIMPNDEGVCACVCEKKRGMDTSLTFLL